MIALVFKRNFGFKDGSFFLRGEEGVFNNNEAHSLIERGVAVKKKDYIKEVYKAPKDKMMKRTTRKVKTKYVA